jgi:acetyl-CoA carboxylase biotin carboxyl carrier protein
MLSFKEIKELIDLVSERGLSGLEIERTGFRLRIEGGRPTNSNGLAEAASVPATALSPGSSGEPAAEEAEDVHVITSPIVGTFYRAPSPEAESFAEVGSRVSKGKVLCIIESMKLMNEIESDVEGEIVAVYARNGQPVEYGEKLFGIRLAA